MLGADHASLMWDLKLPKITYKLKFYLIYENKICFQVLVILLVTHFLTAFRHDSNHTEMFYIGVTTYCVLPKVVASRSSGPSATSPFQQPQESQRHAEAQTALGIGLLSPSARKEGVYRGSCCKKQEESL